eukprot:COSAG02_NODE_2031_length_10066_cov_115.646333_3_plen_438_part_00
MAAASYASGGYCPAGYGTAVSCAASRKSSVVLAGDIGGTNSRLMLYEVEDGDSPKQRCKAPGRLLFEKVYPNYKYDSMSEVVLKFVADQKEDAARRGDNPASTPTVACLAVAGVVAENSCRLTNIDWVINGGEIARAVGIEHVEIINDFVAQGYGILTLGKDDVTPLNSAKPQPGAPIACLGAGTGLGECFLTPGPGGAYVCWPSEGGHAEWAPRANGSDTTQIEMLQFLKIKFAGWSRISVERIVSGPGICNIYEYLAYRYPEKLDQDVHRPFLSRTREDASLVTTKSTDLAKKAVDIFLSSYGSEAGVTALKFMPFGGLYLTGGVTNKLADRLIGTDSFLDAYYDKGRVSPLLDRVPLYIIRADDTGQRGAHLRAIHLLVEHQNSVELVEGSSLKMRGERALAREQLVAPKSCSVANFMKDADAGLRSTEQHRDP